MTRYTISYYKTLFHYDKVVTSEYLASCPVDIPNITSFNSPFILHIADVIDVW